MKKWFVQKNCTHLEIKQYKSLSDHNVIHSVKIEDRAFIESFMARIELLDSNGLEMIKMGPTAEHSELLFYCEGSSGPQVIEIFNGRFKTPSTGFNSTKNENESPIIQDIEALLMPELNKKIPKVANLELSFKDWTISYLGTKHFDHYPATVSGDIDSFIIIGKDHTKIPVEIRSGQLPPQPFVFELKGHKFTLLSYESDKKERLYPKYYQIIKKSSIF